MDEDLNREAAAYTLQNSLEALLSIQRLDFKTSFLEVVEELRMRREAEIHYEKQIGKFVIEKQELEWQKEALQHQIETLNKQHSESLTAFKKQFQARIFAMEEEKGRYLLAEESKEKEIEGLKETLKMLQISKYTLQNKLNEMEQTLQLHTLAKEDHQKSLNEVEKCYAVITCQFGTIKGVHERLEQNVVEAIQLNKKLTTVNKRQESEIDHLKEELKKVTEDLIRSNVTCQHRAGEENLSLTAKERELQKLQQKLSMEIELKTKITEENIHLKKENQEIITKLQHMQQLLCRQTEANLRMETELNEQKQKYQSLERDNELQREKAKENEEKFLNLQHEYEKAQATWKNEASEVPTENEMPISQKENKNDQATIEVSDNLQLEKTRVKTTVTCPLDSDEIRTEQNYVALNTREINLISAEGVHSLEKCINEDDIASDTSESMLSFITPGLTSGSCIADGEKAAANEGEAANEREDNFLSNETQAKVEIKPPCSCHSIVPIKDPKMLPETLISKTNKNISDATHEGSFTSEPLARESKVQGCTAREKMTNNHSETEVNSVVLSQTIEHNHPTFCSDGLKQSSDISKAGKMSPIQSTACVTYNIHLYQQINTYSEEIHIVDPCKSSKCCEPSNAVENDPHLQNPFCNGVDLKIQVASDENAHNMPLEGNLNVNPEELSQHIYVSEMPNKQLEDNGLKLSEMSTNSPKRATEALPLSTEYESQAADLKVEKMTGSKQKEQFLVVSDKETTLLKDKEESLCSTLTGGMNEEENMGEVCSSSMKTCGNLLNGNGKSCFDLLSKDKTVKSSACLALPRSQNATQFESASMSKMPSFLKEQLCTQEIKNTKSRKIGENMNMKAAENREKTTSASMNRAADILNTGSINPGLKRNPTDEWNAIAKTFYETYFPTESVKTQCPVDLQQKSSELIFKESALLLNDSSHNSEVRDWNSQNIFIRTKLNNIEKFLSSEKSCQPRKRKYDDNPEKPSADKAEM